MSPIIDTLYADPKTLSVLLFKFFRDCHIDCTVSSATAHRFVVVMPEELEEQYFSFLIDNDLAMSSMNFLTKLHDDVEFAKRVIKRVANQNASEAPSGTGGEET